MNKLIKLLIFVFPIWILACDEFSADDPKPLDYYMKFYGNYHNDQLYDIEVTESEEVILAGYRTMDDESEQAWIIKTGADGMVEWEKTYSGENNYRGYGLAVENRIYFAGFEKNESSTQHGFLCQFDLQGEQIDSVSFSIDADDVKDIKFLTEKSNIRLLVHTEKNSSDEICIYELTSTNEVDLISTSPLYRSLEGRLYFNKQESGDMFLTGSFKEVDNEEYYDIMVARLIDDNIVWSYNYGESGVTEKSSGIELVESELYIAATKEINSESNVYILKLSESGLDAEEMEVLLEGNNVSYSIIVNSSDEFVFVGERKIDDFNSKIFMARTSFSGSVLLNNEYGYKGISSGRFVTNLKGSTKGFVIAGNLTTSGTNDDAVDVIVLKVNEQGNWIQ